MATTPISAPARTKSRTAGFTLIELIVVLSVVGLILAIVPAVIPDGGRSSLKRDALGMVSTLRLVRAAAVTEGRDAVFMIDVETGEFGRVGGGSANRLSEDVTISVIAAESERDGPDRTGIRFFPTGSSTGGRITLERDGGGFRISVDWLTGRIAVDDLS